MPPNRTATFATAELAMVLSRYNLGVIESLTGFPRGSRQSPKVGVVCEKGKFLLKRRAPQRSNIDRVRQVHRVQQHLVKAGFPAPKIVPTVVNGQTYLQLRDNVYELFEFVAGEPFDQSASQVEEAGATLARFHRATNDLAESWRGLRGDYHDAAGVRTGLCALGPKLKAHDSFTGDDAALATLIQALLEVYDSASEAVNAAGLRTWPESIVHCDWHPGNLIFSRGRVTAVIDYDSVRRSQPVADIANGVLQFSISAGGDPTAWADHLDEERTAAFIAGYASQGSLPANHLEAIPHLMAESLIAECVPPIHQTGSVGRYSGYRVLEMVLRKVRWLSDHGNRLAAAWRSS